MASHEIRYSRVKPIPTLAFSSVLLGYLLFETGSVPWFVSGSFFVLFGGASFVALLCFFDRRVQIRIDERGLEDRRTGFGLVRWDEMQTVELFRLSRLPSLLRFLKIAAKNGDGGQTRELYFFASYLEMSPTQLLRAIETHRKP